MGQSTYDFDLHRTHGGRKAGRLHKRYVVADTMPYRLDRSILPSKQQSAC